MSADQGRTRWIVHHEVEGGAQGDCHVVFSSEAPHKLFFRKTLKPGSTSERRRRFFTEATLFAGLTVRGVPKIIETNASQYANRDVTLYYISEYIEGERLDRLNGGEPLDEGVALNLFRKLLGILLEIHENEVVHRDIEPENIVVAGEELFLVDFGIAHEKGSDETTRQGDELGNRFLRLPEHSAGSLNKRDVRSDITAAVAVALYCLTRTYPRTLVDASGSFPHQRTGVVARLAGLRYGSIWNLIFDRAFRHNLEERWQSVSVVLEMLDAMSEKGAGDIEESRNLLLKHGQSIDGAALLQVQRRLERARSILEECVEECIRKEAPGYRTEKQRRLWKPGDVECWSEIRAYPLGSRAFVSFELTSSIVGSQVASSITLGPKSVELYRNALDDTAPPDACRGVSLYVIPILAKFLFPRSKSD